MVFLPNYDMATAAALVSGCDLWLNTPIVPREASGTSGMTAAMNGSINVSTNDGWICEFEHASGPTQNSFIVPQTIEDNPDTHDREHLFQLLEEDILPMYYDRPADWQANSGQANRSQVHNSPAVITEILKEPLCSRHWLLIFELPLR